MTCPCSELRRLAERAAHHEHTHVLPRTHDRLPALVNAVLGKSCRPDQAQPRWILEGWRFARKASTRGGVRVRSTRWTCSCVPICWQTTSRRRSDQPSARRWPREATLVPVRRAFHRLDPDGFGPDTFGRRQRLRAKPDSLGINRSIGAPPGHLPRAIAGWQRHLRDKYTLRSRQWKGAGYARGRASRIADKSWLHRASCRRARGTLRARRAPVLRRRRQQDHRLLPRAAGVAHAGLGDETEIVTRAAGAVASFEPPCNLMSPASRRRGADTI